MKNKRNFQLLSAIISIVIGAVIFINASLTVSDLMDLQLIFVSDVEMSNYLETLNGVYSLIVLSSLATIIVASFFCRNKNYKTIPISLICLLGFNIISEIVAMICSGEISYNIFVYVAVCAVAITFLIFYLKVKIDPDFTTASTQIINPFKEQEQDQPKKEELPEKIKVLLKLKEFNEISEDEFKKLLLKELNKNSKD